MKKLIYTLSLSLILISCYDKRNDYQYRIEGNIKSNTPAIAYTDSIYGQNEDSIWYYNSDGSKLTILSPYKVYKLK
jgi:hypothetical protein